jgi:hypothetical protein
VGSCCGVRGLRACVGILLRACVCILLGGGKPPGKTSGGCQLLAPGARAWAPVAGVRGHPVAGVRLHPVGPAGCVFGSCSSVVARCCCSRLTGRKSRPLPYVLALRASQRWTKRGPNVDPTWTQTKQKVGKSFYSIFLLFLPLSLSLSLSLSRGSILATVGSDSCTFPTNRRPA